MAPAGSGRDRRVARRSGRPCPVASSEPNLLGLTRSQQWETLTDENGVRNTHRIGDLDGHDSGWAPIGYRVGFEQFSNELSFRGKAFVTGAGATGLDTGERIPDDHLAGPQFRFGEHITAWNVHVTEDDKLGQIPAVYQNPEVPRFDVPAIESGHPGPIREDYLNRPRALLVGQSPIDFREPLTGFDLGGQSADFASFDSDDESLLVIVPSGERLDLASGVDASRSNFFGDNPAPGVLDQVLSALAPPGNDELRARVAEFTDR